MVPASSSPVMISIHALREEGDLALLSHDIDGNISIHALREEGDSFGLIPGFRPCDFYPRPPRGGRRAAPCRRPPCLRDFYPRPPRGGRHGRVGVVPALLVFLSTPSARRATMQ